MRPNSFSDNSQQQMPERAVILLAEDEEDYVLLLKSAFEQAKLKNPVHVVSTGTEAMAYLKGEGNYANRDEYPLPALLLLDIKLPGFTGVGNYWMGEESAWVDRLADYSAYVFRSDEGRE